MNEVVTKDAIQVDAQLKHDTQLSDPAEHLADWIIKNWQFEQSDAPDRWFTTADTDKLIENGDRAFGVTIRNPEQVLI